MHLILKDGTYAVGPFKPEGAIEVPPKPNRIETTWDGSQWVETDASKAVKYQRDRADAYPSIQEQLDMQYWDAVNGTKKWQEAVAKVKADNPNPE